MFPEEDSDCFEEDSLSLDMVTDSFVPAAVGEVSDGAWLLQPACTHTTNFTTDNKRFALA